MGELSPLDVRLVGTPSVDVEVDTGNVTGPAEMWRHALSQGGFGPEPLPDRVVEAVRKLKLRRIRIFLQEVFDIYQGPGEYRWDLLDAYMDALEPTGAKVVTCLTLKPRLLFPEIDQTVWRPNDVDEWQGLIKALVRRYSTERQLVTHWEVTNEPNLANGGGAPYTITDPEDYHAFYTMTSEAVIAADPSVKVGGPALADGVLHEPLPGFVELCKKHGTRLDFLSWHNYTGDRHAHARGVEQAKELLVGIEPTPELNYTEWNRRWGGAAVAESAFDPAWASSAAAIAVSVRDAGLDWGYFYRIWDRSGDPAVHGVFTPPERLPVKMRMLNSAARRLGMLGPTGNAQPSYFAMQAIANLQSDRVTATTADPGVVPIATSDETGVTILVASDSFVNHQDRIVNVKATGIPWPRVKYELFRVDEERHWDDEALELIPLDERQTWTTDSQFWTSVLLPAASLAIVKITPLEQ